MEKISSEKRSRVMSKIHSEDTSIEIRLRKALWHAGIRYRKNYKALPGKPDVAITKYKIAVFCDSSFFHGKDFETKKPVATNHAYWDQKIRRNMERDREVNQQLRAMGWTVLRFWDVDINKHLEDCVQAVKESIMEATIQSE